VMPIALRAHLAADAGVASIASNGTTARIFPHVIPQKTDHADDVPRVPCIVYELAGEDRDRRFCGTSRLIRSRWRIKCFAVKFADAIALGDAVRNALIDFSGVMGTGADAVEVRDCALDQAFSVEDMEPGLFRVEQTYSLWIVEE
jgi:hypothetical protein